MLHAGPNSTFAIVLLATLPFCGTPACRAQTPGAAAGQETKAKPFSLADVEKELKYYSDHVASEQEVLEDLARGIDFKLDQETLTKLRNAGATGKMIAEIDRLQKKDDPKGIVLLTCKPAECKIKFDGTFVSETSEGTLKRTGVKLGELTIDFEKEGYLTEQQSVNIGPLPGKSISVELKPTDATKAILGRKLYEMMINALGGAAGLKSLDNINGTGALTTYKDSKPSEWDFDVTIAPSRVREMKISNTAGGVVFLGNGEKLQQKKKKLLKGGKQLPNGVVLEIENNLRLLCQYDLVTFVGKLNSSSVRFTATTADPAGKEEQHLNADTGASVYELTLGADARPTMVEDNPKSGLGGAVKIVYGEYAKVGDSYYPKHTSVGISAGSGIAVRLDHVEAGSVPKKK